MPNEPALAGGATKVWWRSVIGWLERGETGKQWTKH